MIASLAGREVNLIGQGIVMGSRLSLAKNNRIVALGVCFNARIEHFADAIWFLYISRVGVILCSESRAAILTGLIVTPNAAWSQTMPSQVQVSPAPTQKTEAASTDDRSYLPPSMRAENVATNAAVPVAAETIDKPAGRTRSARRHKKLNRRYAQGYDSGFGLFND
jgi:hypothetical protein